MHDRYPLFPASFLEPVEKGRIAHPGIFPVIESIEELRTHLAGRLGIGIYTHGDITICRYTLSIPDTFSSALDLECRGLVFDTVSGALLSRPFHKFFNLGERQGVFDLDFREGFDTEEKLDGSMICAFRRMGKIHFHTRGGITPQARDARAQASSAIIALAHDAADAGKTPVFEYTGPDNRIIIAYDEPRITLLSLRDIRTGEYDEGLADDLARIHGVARPRREQARIMSADDLHAFLEAGLSERTDTEGVILVAPDGHRVKIKTADYLRRHRILTNLGQEKYAYMAWLEDVVDDTAAALGGDRARALLRFAEDCEAALAQACARVEDFVAPLRDQDRKAAAMAINAGASGAPKSPAFQALAFAALDGDPRKRALEMLARVVRDEGRRTALRQELELPSWQVDLESLR